MEALNPSTTVNSPEEGLTKEVKKRNSYVSRDHKSMIAFVSNVYKNLGGADYHSNKAIATVNDMSPDSIKQQLTSAQQYKLLEIKFGTGYKVTDLFKRIYLPLSDAEKRSAIIESLKAPETYTQLFKDYEFQIVPPLQGIKNHFVRYFHFREEVAERTGQIFLQNLNEYGLLDNRGVLTSGMPIFGGIAAPEEIKPPKLSQPDDSNLPEDTKPPEDLKKKIMTEATVKMIDITIPLKSTKSKAHLLLPEDYQDEDLERIAKFVEALK